MCMNGRVWNEGASPHPPFSKALAAAVPPGAALRPGGNCRASACCHLPLLSPSPCLRLASALAKALATPLPLLQTSHSCNLSLAPPDVPSGVPQTTEFERDMFPGTAKADAPQLTKDALPGRPLLKESYTGPPMAWQLDHCRAHHSNTDHMIQDEGACVHRLATTLH